MSILNFQKPEEVVMINNQNHVGDFEFRLFRTWIWFNSRQCIKKSFIIFTRGFAITSVKIKGVDCEFSSIKGVVQDVTEIILNQAG